MYHLCPISHQLYRSSNYFFLFFSRLLERRVETRVDEGVFNNTGANQTKISGVTRPRKKNILKTFELLYFFFFSLVIFNALL